MSSDVVLGEIIREYFESIAREMNATMDNTSLSPVFNEAHDCSAGLFFRDRDETNLIARANAAPPHIFASLYSVAGLLGYYRNDLADGDVVMVNDPYFYGSHIPDWTVMKPVFYRNKPVFFPAVRAHMAEIGGPVPGGYNSSARDIWQEGFRLAPVKLFERGELKRDILDLLKANNRQPEVMAGDLNAMIGACGVAERRLVELIEKYSFDRVLEGTRYVLDYSERRLRAELARWPDGSYSGRSVLDSDFAGTRDLNVDCTIEVRGDEVEVDFSGTHAQTRGFVNSTPGNTTSWVYSAFTAVFDDIPVNSGFFRPIKVRLPEASVVNPRPPAPVGNSTICIGNDIGQATMKALEQIVPERVGAATLDFVVDVYHGFDHRVPGDPPFFVGFDFYATPVSSGAAFGTDGWGAWSSPHSSLRINTIEMLEVQHPVTYLQAEYAQDTVAAGQWRGTPAFHMQRMNPDGATVTHGIFIQGHRHPLQGFAGGAQGAGNYAILDYRGPDETLVTEGVFQYESRPGEVIFVQSGGGGGWGDPLARDPALVLGDVRAELISIEGARDDYGVVVGAGPVVLEEATRTLRAERRMAETEHGADAVA